MRREGAYAVAVANRPVRLTTGENQRLTLSLLFDRSGALVNVGATLPPAPQASEAERAAALLVEAIGGKLRRRPDIGIAELCRRAEAALHLLEQLRDIEAEQGYEARALLKDVAA